MRRAAPSSTALLVLAVLVTLASSYFAWLPRPRPTGFWLVAIVPTLLVAVLAGWKLQDDGELRRVLRPVWGDFTLAFLATLALFALGYAFMRFVAPPASPRFSWLLHVYERIGDPADLRAKLPAVVGAILVAAAAEEIVWRGVVTDALAERVGSSRAWIWSAVLAAAAQLPSAFALHDERGGLADPGPNPLIPCLALGGGLVWGFMVRRSQRLLPAILAHALFDWTVLFLFRLAEPRF